MSICKMPSQRMYWWLETRYGKVADVMWPKRFEEIKKNLHFNDNNDFDNNDKLFKIRPFIDYLTSKFFYEEVTEHASIDEQTIPFKGQSLLKRYNKDTPKKWGYKVYVLCADDGRVLSFKIDTGKVERVLDNPDLETTGNIVLWFMDRLADQGHKLYIDNWYNSADLADLKRLGTGLIGIVWEDRLKGCKSFSSDSEMAKRVKRDGRGIMELSVAKEKDIETRCIKWYDNHAVKVLTNFASISPITMVQRWDRKLKKHIDVPLSALVKQYNAHMGGVDLLNMLIALYRIHLRSKKWYLKIVFNFLDVVVVHCWLQYRKDCRTIGFDNKEIIPLLDFKMQVANSLMKTETEELQKAPKRRVAEGT